MVEGAARSVAPVVGLIAIAFLSCEWGASSVAPPRDEYLPIPDLSGAWTADVTEGELTLVGTGTPVGRCEVHGWRLSLIQEPEDTVAGLREAGLFGEYAAAAMICRGAAGHLPLPEPFGGDTILVMAGGVVEGTIRDWCPDSRWPVGGCHEPYVPGVYLTVLDIAPAYGGHRFHLSLDSERPTSTRMSGVAGLNDYSWEVVLEGGWEATR